MILLNQYSGREGLPSTLDSGGRNHTTVERDEAAAYEGLQRKMAMSEGQEMRSQQTRKHTTCIQQAALQRSGPSFS